MILYITQFNKNPKLKMKQNQIKKERRTEQGKEHEIIHDG